MRAYFKKTFRLIALLIVSPLIILSKISSHFLNSNSLFSTSGQVLSLVPGVTGNFLRYAFYRSTLVQLGFNSSLYFGCLITKRKSKIGNNCRIGAFSSIGHVHIGDGVIVANRVVVLSGRRHHNFDDPDKSIYDGGTSTCLNIGNDVFIGDNSVVMANIGEKSIIGAGTVVVKDIPSYSVAVGNPARVVRKRASN